MIASGANAQSIVFNNISCSIDYSLPSYVHQGNGEFVISGYKNRFIALNSFQLAGGELSVSNLSLIPSTGVSFYGYIGSQIIFKITSDLAKFSVIFQINNYDLILNKTRTINLSYKLSKYNYEDYWHELVNLSSLVKIEYPSISGTTVVCPSNRTFTLQNLPPNGNINWTKSNNLAYVSGQGTDSYTVRAINSTTNGAGTISAILTYGEETFTLTKDVWISSPPTDLSIHVPSEPIDCSYDAMVWASASPSNITYDWSVSGADIISQNGNEILVNAYCPQKLPLYMTFQLSASNSCGSSSVSKTVQVVDNDMFNPLSVSMFIYPNPVKDILTIEFTEDESGGFNPNINSKIYLYDKLMNTVKYDRFKGLSTTMNLSGLQPDTYILRVINGNESFEQKVIVSDK